MNLEAINKWLDEEYGCSYTRLEELHDFYFKKYCDLQQENKILKENAENNDKVVDKVNWENQLLKKKNKQLQERMEYLERSNNRREDTIFEQSQKISDLEDNWEKIKEHLTNRYNNGTESISYRQVFLEIREMMQEIEQGSDSNE